MNVYWRGRVCPYVSFVSETAPQSSITFDVVGEAGYHRKCSDWPRAGRSRNRDSIFCRSKGCDSFLSHSDRLWTTQ